MFSACGGQAQCLTSPVLHSELKIGVDIVFAYFYNIAMKIKVEEIYKPDTSSSLGRPLFISTVPAGFPSPASDYEESKLVPFPKNNFNFLFIQDLRDA
ncbi:hypothetical protein L21SP3_00461 [Sedimentisphaera cyanobacteriorum]|uniref:Uncharacterized protein n=1 Tax=Sedimentisphaera cyanobacteriorum TaxID=1940790 RepID=A0A1Q2HMK0_9BACT|nr:hypothetical protein [Sedimentisphaera cyanobacteriorum]AQQ08672.1 hypothetical protein L21SP3_00461 [Sedimentisphaera cyanobacteriorum]